LCLIEKEAAAERKAALEKQQARERNNRIALEEYRAPVDYEKFAHAIAGVLKLIGKDKSIESVRERLRDDKYRDMAWCVPEVEARYLKLMGRKKLNPAERRAQRAARAARMKQTREKPQPA
jgi:hypothetical protein